MSYLPQILIAIGMFFTFWGGFLAFKKQSEFRINQNELSTKNNQLAETNNQLATENKQLTSTNISLTQNNKDLIEKNIGLTNSNQELAKSNLELSKNNNELANKTLEISEVAKNYTVGSNELLKIDFRDDFHKYTDRIALMASHRDKIPIFDLKMRVTELYSYSMEEHEKWIQENREYFEKHGKPKPLKNRHFNFEVDVYQPQNYLTFGYLPVPLNGQIGHYNITIATRARIYYLSTYVRKNKDGKWVSYSEYYEDFAREKLLAKHVMRDFPVIGDKPNLRK